MRTSFTIAIAKIVFWMNRQTGSGGSALPGLVAERLQPDILKSLAKSNFAKGVVIITGTNGKTTTSRMVAEILDAAGVSYIHNKAGSNLSRGIISTFIAEASLSGCIKADLALLEVDEASVPVVAAALKPTVLVVTNLFRDQLDRYGEVDSTAQLLRKALKNFKGTLCLNADDPLVASLGATHNKQTKYFGVSDYDGQSLEHDTAIDVIKSPLSDTMLRYKKRYFGHVGIYESVDGSYKRPHPDVEIIEMIKENDAGSQATAKIGGKKLELSLALPGLYNIYNGLAALSVADCLKLDLEAATKTLANVTAAFGRMEKIEYQSRQLFLLLIKNPTGFNQVIATFLKPAKQQPLLIIINDNFADGRDVSWLWDAALEDIAGYEGPIYVSGIRAYDMVLRLNYAGLTNIKVEPDIEGALEAVTNKTEKGSKAYILPTYTAMLAVRKLLVKKTETAEFWQ